jgi:hypothetical protein
MMNRSELLARAEVKKAIAEIRDALRGALPEASFGEREEQGLAINDEALRELLREDLQTMSDDLGDEVLVDGVAYKRHEPGTDTYLSLCGPLEVNRPSYRSVGVHNGPIVIALELAAGLIEGATPALAYSVTHGYAQHDMRAHLESLEAAHRRPPSRTTLERIAKRIASTAVEHGGPIEARVRRAERVPAEAVAVSIGLDRTSAPMVEDRPADAPPKPGRKRRRPRLRRAPPPYDINWRMAYVGTVCFVDANGEALRTIRYASAACDDPHELVGKMTADVSAALGRRPSLHVGIVQDGAPEMWNRTREGLQALCDQGRLGAWHEAIDRYHLLERLAEALNIVEPHATEQERKDRLGHWRDLLDTTDAAIDYIEQFLIKGYDGVRGGDRDTLWEHLRYIRNNNDRMRYVTLRRVGLPVGSGVTESTCKTVIGQRAKGAGQRWREAGLRGVVTLRALHHSDRLPRFWSHLATHYAANVQAA